MTELHAGYDVEEFAAATTDYLLADPVANTVALTQLDRLRAGRRGGRTHGAARLAHR